MLVRARTNSLPRRFVGPRPGWGHARPVGLPVRYGARPWLGRSRPAYGRGPWLNRRYAGPRYPWARGPVLRTGPWRRGPFLRRGRWAGGRYWPSYATPSAPLQRRRPWLFRQQPLPWFARTLLRPWSAPLPYVAEPPPPIVEAAPPFAIAAPPPPDEGPPPPDAPPTDAAAGADAGPPADAGAAPEGAPGGDAGGAPGGSPPNEGELPYAVPVQGRPVRIQWEDGAREFNAPPPSGGGVYVVLRNGRPETAHLTTNFQNDIAKRYGAELEAEEEYSRYRRRGRGRRGGRRFRFGRVGGRFGRSGGIGLLRSLRSLMAQQNDEPPPDGDADDQD
jgi:hypothetical protein